MLDGLQAAALDVLRGVASLLLSTFPTTVEEDRQQLAASSDADLQLALRFRIEKKRVLLDAINAISHKRKVRSPAPESTQTSARWTSQSQGEYEAGCTEVVAHASSTVLTATWFDAGTGGRLSRCDDGLTLA